jgi:4-amino-4-deoxychorismate lyase
MIGAVLINGIEGGRVSPQDRGLAYGDGLFETMLVSNGAAPWWDGHVARLRRGCERLGIELPDLPVLAAERDQLCAGVTTAVLKLIVTRGDAGRGYAPPLPSHPTRIVALHPAPARRLADYRDGIALHACRTRLAMQPALAGIKHLNRLEQVLARAEWKDEAFGEGLMFDGDGRAVCATAANIFVVVDGRLFTPDLSRCGVEGTCRAWICAHESVSTGEVDAAMLDASDEFFLASSLRGILPVARFGGRQWNVGPMTRTLQERLWQAVPALDPRRSANA